MCYEAQSHRNDDRTGRFETQWKKGLGCPMHDGRRAFQQLPTGGTDMASQSTRVKFTVKRG
jgi:hypothetical protein